MWKATALVHETDFNKQQRVFRSKKVRTTISSIIRHSLIGHTEYSGMQLNINVLYPESIWFFGKIKTTREVF
jgi:hypothetical protein